MKYVLWIGVIFTVLMAVTGTDPLWPMILFAGIAANGLVVALNGWKMPVRGQHVEGIRHTSMVPSTRLKWLADVIPTGMGIASIGDFLIAAGTLGLWATRGHIPYVEFIALSAFGVWVLGWSRGFDLFTKWTAEERRDVRKNIPIVLLLMIVGNLFGIRGCGAGELRATAEASIPHIEAKVAPARTHSLGKLVGSGNGISLPDIEVLHRLKQATDRSHKLVSAAIAKGVAAAIDQKSFTRGTFVQKFSGTDGKPMLVTFTQRTPRATEKSSRRGPFCRVTCAAHHGGEYDVETLPEACKANYIPPTSAQVPGWYEDPADPAKEYTSLWPGPATAGFEKYTLYWSAVQSAAKTIHPSNKFTTSTTVTMGH